MLGTCGAHGTRSHVLWTTCTERVYTLFMLKRTNVYLDTKILKELEAIGKTLGGLKVAQVIRMALQEFVNSRKEGKQ
jgi:hypothetical protein